MADTEDQVQVGRCVARIQPQVGAAITVERHGCSIDEVEDDVEHGSDVEDDNVDLFVLLLYDDELDEVEHSD